MKKKRLLLSVFLCTVVSASNAETFEVDGIKYYYVPNRTTCYVTTGSSASGDVTIPSEVTYDGITYSVTSIGYQAFRQCSGLKSITISNGVTSIDDGAFERSVYLKSVTIPNSVTSIGAYAFAGCHSLSNVTIPSGVTEIKEATFNDSGITTMVIPSGVTSIGVNAFAYCTKMASVTIPNSVVKIGGSAFMGCEVLTDVAVPNSVKSLGVCAFEDCSALASVAIGSGVTSIEERTFAGCISLPSVVIPEGVTSIGERAFYNCKSLASVTMPTSIASIGGSAFYDCESLASVKIPEGVTSVGKSAFGYCKSLTSVTIPNGVTSISSSAFSSCIALQNVTIPEGVKSIEDGAFSSCKALNVIIPKSVTSIGRRAFNSAVSITMLGEVPCSIGSTGDAFSYTTKIYVPYGTGEAYKSADGWSWYYESEIFEYGDDEVSFTMTDAGWGTLIVPFDHSVPNGLTAYTCGGYTTSDGVNWLTLTEASTITANTPYIMAGEAGTYVFTGTPNMAGSVFTEGLLTGVYVPTTINEGSVLQNHDGEVAFYAVAASDPKAVPAYRCYLNSSAPSGSVAFRLNDTTGIIGLTVNEDDDMVYDLQGRSVCGPLKNGVYIRNGKMVLVK